MAVITLPADPAPRSVRWTLVRASQLNRSEFTGRSQRVQLARTGFWRAEIEYPPIRGEAAIRPWRAALALLRGRLNQFRIEAVEGDQATGLSPTVNGAGQTGATLVTAGWGASGLKLVAGCFVTVADQLLQLTADVVSASGASTLQFQPALHASPADGAAIIVTRPTALLSLSDDSTGWTVEPGPFYRIALSAEETW